ncbi:MAG: 30S ribosomal protein S20 [Nitrospinae bacterium]|nr:30S ribosomal protein S20 [Nitrospinota bacterium]
MPNHKSSEKRVRQTEVRTERNKGVRSACRTAVKKLRQAIEEKNTAAVAELLKEATSTLHAAASKGVIHRNNAARRISRLALQVNKLSA